MSNRDVSRFVFLKKSGGCVALLLGFCAVAVDAQPLAGGSAGCWMAHCDPQLDNTSGMVLPSGFTQIAHDTSGASSGWGLGCSSNGSIFVCAYTSNGGIYPGPYLKAYDTSGNVLWSSWLLDTVAISCAPMVLSDGEVIACDDTQMARFDALGNIEWDSCFYGGTGPACTCPDGISLPPCSPAAGQNYPSSPVQLANGSIILATGGSAGHGGKIFNIDSVNGTIISSIYLGRSGADSYITTNTPCVSASTGPDNGNRIFDITNFSADPSRARMYAITVGPSAMTVAWVYPTSGDFSGPSQASPLCAGNGFTDGVFTDAADSTNSARGAVWGWRQSNGAIIFACDDGPAGTGCPSAPYPVNGGFAVDTRPSSHSFWMFSGGTSSYVRRSLVTGNILQGISLRAPFIPGEQCDLVPSSATVMSTDSLGNQALVSGLISRNNCGGGAYVTAIDAVTGALQGYFQIESNVNAAAPGYAVGQFALASTLAGNVIGFGVSHSGMYIIGTAP